MTIIDDSPPHESNPKLTRAKVFERIVTDARVSAGAFRLWHWLYHRRDKQTDVVKYEPVREIADAIHCSKDSIGEWRQELEAAKYLTAAARKRRQLPNGATPPGHQLQYTVLDGDGYRVSMSGNQDKNPVRKSGQNPRPKQRDTLSGSKGQAVLKGGTYPIVSPKVNTSGEEASPPGAGALAPLPDGRGGAGTVKKDSYGNPTNFWGGSK